MHIPGVMASLALHSDLHTLSKQEAGEKDVPESKERLCWVSPESSYHLELYGEITYLAS